VAFAKVLTMYQYITLEFIPSSIPVIPSFPDSWNSYKMYQYCNYMHVYTFFALYPPFCPLSPTPPTGANPHSGQDLFHLPVLQFCRREKIFFK
jgi:hypothetical protein